MSFTYRLCVTTTKEKQATFFQPKNYDPNNFLILQRYIESLIASGKYPSGVPLSALFDISPYSRHHCPTNEIHLFSFYSILSFLINQFFTIIDVTLYLHFISVEQCFP
jgi:hypothetical protein